MSSYPSAPTELAATSPRGKSSTNAHLTFAGGGAGAPHSTGITRQPSNSYANSHQHHSAPHPVRSASSSSYSGTFPKSPTTVEVKHGKLPGQIWMPEGIVDMASFGQILSMDDKDPSREFSKALVWAWCDQAEMAIEEMEQCLLAGNIVPLADKAHYLKGSSSSLGLVKVSATCQSIYHTHFPPSLAHLRAFSYTGGGNSGMSSASRSASSSSTSTSPSSSSSSPSARTSSTASPFSSYQSDSSSGSSTSDSEKPGLASPRLSPSAVQQGFPFDMNASTAASRTAPGLASSYVCGNWTGSTTTSEDNATGQSSDPAAHFQAKKLDRASVMLEQLKLDVRESSEWLYAYYRESDKYAGL